jgi:hypothetical protein
MPLPNDVFDPSSGTDTICAFLIPLVIEWKPVVSKNYQFNCVKVLVDVDIGSKRSTLFIRLPF